MNFDRNQKVARDFAEFMESTLGLKYELTAAKILRRKSPERAKAPSPKKGGTITIQQLDERDVYNQQIINFENQADYHR